jgi:AcrR family transcriptional regulator
MATDAVLPVHQARSRESLRKLLDAAREVLGRHGTDGATIARIARHAGLTPGSVYRRFKDKESLVEAAILEILEQQEETMKTRLTEIATRQVPLPEFTAMLIGGMVGAYRANAGLLRGMRQFMQSRMGSAFWKNASALEAAHFQRTVNLFLLFRKDIHHPQPGVAVSLALRMIAGALYSVVVWPMQRTKATIDLLPVDDDALTRELTRAFLSYLGVET